MKHKLTEKQLDALLEMTDVEEVAYEFARVYKRSLKRSKMVRYVARESVVLTAACSAAIAHGRVAETLNGLPLVGWYAVPVVGLVALFWKRWKR